jgi:hypothetical protein
MNQLSIERINEYAPYKVEVEDGRSSRHLFLQKNIRRDIPKMPRRFVSVTVSSIVIASPRRQQKIVRIMGTGF